ncbi:histone-fold-containing protein [Gloeopeniophorella convolvens]|nr:histone-fold-containing protein [Gloeopeniophorella convolvens]
MPRKDTTNTPASAQAQQEAVSEGIENFELPRALVTRIAKSAVPDNVKLQKDTVLSLVKGATVFINYLGAAHEVSTSKQHKSISASDVLKALELIEFADLIPPLQAELQVYRDLAKSKKSPQVVAPTSRAAKLAPHADDTESYSAIREDDGNDEGEIDEGEDEDENQTEPEGEPDEGEEDEGDAGEDEDVEMDLDLEAEQPASLSDEEADE